MADMITSTVKVSVRTGGERERERKSQSTVLEENLFVDDPWLFDDGMAVFGRAETHISFAWHDKH